MRESERNKCREVRPIGIGRYASRRPCASRKLIRKSLCHLFATWPHSQLFGRQHSQRRILSFLQFQYWSRSDEAGIGQMPAQTNRWSTRSTPDFGPENPTWCNTMFKAHQAQAAETCPEVAFGSISCVSPARSTGVSQERPALLAVLWRPACPSAKAKAAAEIACTSFALVPALAFALAWQVSHD